MRLTLKISCRCGLEGIMERSEGSCDTLHMIFQGKNVIFQGKHVIFQRKSASILSHVSRSYQ